MFDVFFLHKKFKTNKFPDSDVRVPTLRTNTKKNTKQQLKIPNFPRACSSTSDDLGVFFGCDVATRFWGERRGMFVEKRPPGDREVAPKNFTA